MANYASLYATIAANIYENHLNQVTAEMVKAACDSMVASLGYGYQFRGAAAPGDAGPGNIDQRVFYIASTPGTYSGFGGLTLAANEVALLKWDSVWSKETLDIPSKTQIMARLAAQDAQIAVQNGRLDGQDEEIADFEEAVQNQVDNYPMITINGNVTNAPDEEDITSDANDLLKFKNRSAVDGMGYVILRKGGDNTFASQVTAANTIYEIRYDFDLDGGTVTIPENCVLKFKGGSIENGTLIADSASFFDGKFVLARIVSNSGSKLAVHNCVFTLGANDMAISVSGAAEKIIIIEHSSFLSSSSKENTCAIVLGDAGDCVNAIIDHCFFYWVTNAIKLKNHIHPLTISNCHFEFGKYDIDSVVVGAQTCLYIHGNHFQAGVNGWRAIRLDGATSVDIRDNLFQFSKRQDVTAIALSGCSDVSISNLHVEFGNSDDKDSNHVIYANTTANCIIDNIRVTGAVADIVYLGPSNFSGIVIRCLHYLPFQGTTSLNYFVVNKNTDPNKKVCLLESPIFSTPKYIDNYCGVALHDITPNRRGTVFVTASETIDLSAYKNNDIIRLNIKFYVINTTVFDELPLLLGTTSTGYILWQHVQYAYDKDTGILTLTKSLDISYNPYMQYAIDIDVYKNWI